jgi:aminoacrylate peracid reductase
VSLGAADGQISPSILDQMVDGILYVSGVLPLDAAGAVVHPGDAAAQTRHVLEAIKSVVEAAGGSLRNVVHNAIFIKNLSDYAALNRVYAEYFAAPYPARYCIQCSLVRADALVEISTIAHIA